MPTTHTPKTFGRAAPLRRSCALGLATLAVLGLATAPARAQTRPPASVPEPSPLAFVGLGAVGLILTFRRRKSGKTP